MPGADGTCKQDKGKKCAYAQWDFAIYNRGTRSNFLMTRVAGGGRRVGKGSDQNRRGVGGV
jgi:hypothetical protein